MQIWKVPLNYDVTITATPARTVPNDRYLHNTPFFPRAPFFVLQRVTKSVRHLRLQNVSVLDSVVQNLAHWQRIWIILSCVLSYCGYEWCNSNHSEQLTHTYAIGLTAVSRTSWIFDWFVTNLTASFNVTKWLQKKSPLNKDRPTWCHLFYYFTIYCSTSFEC